MFFHFELVKMSESGGGWGWITMRWFDRSSESKGERNDGDSPGFACYGYGYHEEDEKDDKKRMKKNQENRR